MNGQSVRLKAALTSGETLINMYELFNGKDTMTIEDAVQDASITLDLSAKKINNCYEFYAIFRTH